MELKISTEQMLKILLVFSWIIFVGVCIDAGTFIFAVIYTKFINPGQASSFNLSELYQFDSGYYYVVLLFMNIVGIMKAILFYHIIKILHDKKLNMTRPFSREIGGFIFKLSYLSLGIGLFSYWAVKYTAWLVSLKVKMPDIQNLRLGGADVWLFMGVTLLVIAHIFKRGIEIQSENELTI